jgi:hypothetical protein
VVVEVVPVPVLVIVLVLGEFAPSLGLFIREEVLNLMGAKGGGETARDADVVLVPWAE